LDTRKGNKKKTKTSKGPGGNTNNPQKKKRKTLESWGVRVLATKELGTGSKLIQKHLKMGGGTTPSMTNRSPGKGGFFAIKRWRLICPNSVGRKTLEGRGYVTAGGNKIFKDEKENKKTCVFEESWVVARKEKVDKERRKVEKSTFTRRGANRQREQNWKGGKEKGGGSGPRKKVANCHYEEKTIKRREERGRGNFIGGGGPQRTLRDQNRSPKKEGGEKTHQDWKGKESRGTTWIKKDLGFDWAAMKKLRKEVWKQGIGKEGPTACGWKKLPRDNRKKLN